MLVDGGEFWQGRVWYEHLTYARRLVGPGGYVVELIQSDDLDPLRWQYFLELCRELQLTPILRLATTYDHQGRFWSAPPKDPDERRYTQAARRFRDFLAALRWPSGPRYVVVGNEPNRGDEWGNRPNAAEYARYLVDIAAALHPLGISILGPALDPYAPNSRGQLLGGYRFVDAETFLDDLAAADTQAFAAIDVWASHAYPLDPFREDPSKQVFKIDDVNPSDNSHRKTPLPGIFNRGINSYRWELWRAAPFLGSRASTLPVLITETGWRHPSENEPSPGDFAHADVSQDLLAAYVDLAYRGNHGRYPTLPDSGWTPWNDDPRVLGAVLFTLDGAPGGWSHSNLLHVDVWGNVTGTSAAFDKICEWMGREE